MGGKYLEACQYQKALPVLASEKSENWALIVKLAFALSQVSWMSHIVAVLEQRNGESLRRGLPSPRTGDEAIEP